MDKIVLFMDNITDFLEVHSRLLEQAGYQVLRASTLEEAEKILAEKRVHLAIFDIRMLDEDDEHDISGLVLAQKETYRPLPKIILTGYPSYEYVRDALGLPADGLPPAVNFIGKGEGSKALIQAVERAFEQHVRINRDLVIQYNEQNSVAFLHLVTLIEPALKGERLLARAAELEDLFRRLCYKSDQIKIDRLLWQRAGRFALAVFAFTPGKVPASYVVVCGQNARVADQARRYREFAPKAVGELGTALSAKAETLNFAANAYTLADTGLENVISLAELYQTGPERLFNTALDNLLQKTLGAWYQEKRIPEGVKSLGQVYRERLGLDETRMPPSMFEERVQAIVDQSPTVGTKVERTAGRLTIRFDGQSYDYPDPTQTLYQTSANERMVLLLHSSGGLSGDNILVDHSGRTWLTDFTEAGLVPLFWNFVTLEAVIRFDLTEAARLQWLHDMERCLIAGDFGKLDMSDLESPLRKTARAIQSIRRVASQMIGKDPMQYHFGMLFHAASRIVDFNPAFRLMPNELMRLIHALMSAAMICGRIAQASQAALSPATLDEVGIRIDRRNQAVWVSGAPVSLSRQSFELLCYLYDHADQSCSRREIVQQIFGREYDKNEPSHRSLLNTAIRRLREKIEDDPERPRFLLTAPDGYRLVTRPQK